MVPVKQWRLKFGAALLLLSTAVYVAHYLIFHDAHHLFIFLTEDIAFVFVEVLLVTLVLHELINRREHEEKLEKLKMIVGTFYSEVGTELLATFSDADPDLNHVRSDLTVDEDWTEQDFDRVQQKLERYDYSVNLDGIDLPALRNRLLESQGHMLRLLENPTLIEHEPFTDLLRAVFHLTEELEHRTDLDDLPRNDRDHLEGDVERAYSRLVTTWLDYMEYQKEHYPYLFSLSMRTNPFDRDGSTEIP